MCISVFLTDFVYYDQTLLKNIPVPILSPVELSPLIELVNIEEEFVEDCWCCSDPIPSLLNAGYIVEEDIYGDITGTPAVETSKVIFKGAFDFLYKKKSIDSLVNTIYEY